MLQSQTLLWLCLAGLVCGGAARIARHPWLAHAVWAATAILALAVVVRGIIRDLLKRRVGVDIVALLAILGALALREFLAGAIIGVMMATGGALESYATGRARRELSALISRAPRLAHRVERGAIFSVPVGEVRLGDRLIVKPGEIVPVDGIVVDGAAAIDESALTGEPRPIDKATGDRVSSGTANAGASFHLRAVASAEESTYAGIVRLVREAAEAKAPLSRLADRYALGFVPLTLTVAAVAWALAGNPVYALAVLVVATPCPLILAAPVAIVSGISRAARHGIIVKGGGAFETLAQARILLFDKTGTLTQGFPRLTTVAAFGGADEREVLRLSASLEQASSHVVASSLVQAARDRGLALSFPTEAVEQAGAGLAGRIDGHAVRVGSAEWVASGSELGEEVRVFRRRASRTGAMTVFVGKDGVVTGALVLDDPIRPDSPRTIRALRHAGIRKIAMVTGDHPLVAESVGAALGVDRVFAQRSPGEKVAIVREARAEGLTIMVGDGINDAPALAAADVGVAMGARGATSSTESADVVITVDRLDRLVLARKIAQRSRRIAVESMLVGMGLSLIAMGFAAAGQLPPIAGALLQEAIDVVSIVNALRARGDGRLARKRKLDEAMSKRLRGEHEALIPMLDQVRALADRLDHLEPESARRELDALDRFLTERILVHERADDLDVYPVVAGVLGGEDPLALMSRTHQEIFHLVRLYKRLLEDVDAYGTGPAELVDLRRVLYGLHAILRLHFEQEEDLYSSLSETYLETTGSDRGPPTPC